MTLKRLMIILGILVVLAGVGIAWLWEYAYSPQGRARVIIAQLKRDNTTLRGWMVQHHLIRPGFSEPPPPDDRYVVLYRNSVYLSARDIPAQEEMVKLGRAALPVVIEALQDENSGVRWMALRVCGRLHDPATIEPIANLIHTAPRRIWLRDPDYVSPYVDALIEIGPEAYGPLIEISMHDNSSLRGLAIMKAVDKWGAAAVPHLIETLDDPDEFFRKFAARQLGELKDKRATDALARYLTDSDHNVELYAVSALGKIGDPAAIPALTKLLKDEQRPNYIRISAAGALAGMGNTQGLTYLLAKLKSASPYDRANAADQLGAVHLKETLDPLLSLLSDSSVMVRRCALAAIGELRDPSAIPAVRKLLDDPDPRIREWFAPEALRVLFVPPPPISQPAAP